MDEATHCKRRRYDPGEHRFKHCWNEPRAAFVCDGSAQVGKCPSTLGKQLAEQLLNDGIAYPVGQAHPERIYNVHDGVVYEAVYSGGSCWHGYPARGAGPCRARSSRNWNTARSSKAACPAIGTG